MSDRLEFPVRGAKLTITTTVRERVFSRRSEFQQIDIYDSELFGRILLLDGHIQLTTLDERSYHEALVHVPLMNLRDPRRALVIGGGDGGVLRELVRYPSLERIDMAEIDPMVIEACREHLPQLSAGAFDDPRLALVIGDALEFVQRAEGPIDLVVVDCTDIFEDVEGELSEGLFSESFYRRVAELLSDEGVVVSQADNPIFCPFVLEQLLPILERTFPHSGTYNALVPSFGGASAFAWASKGTRLAERWEDLPSPREDLVTLSPVAYDFAFSEWRL